ncbi:hypothetical protein L7876_002770 [Acinetobacter baumannii]|nr:hypothetical protein [Acinetobacter baumannii]
MPSKQASWFANVNPNVEDNRFLNTRVHNLVVNLPNVQKELLIEILNERAKNSNFQKKYANYLISKLINEKKES